MTARAAAAPAIALRSFLARSTLRHALPASCAVAPAVAHCPLSGAATSRSAWVRAGRQQVRRVPEGLGQAHLLALRGRAELSCAPVLGQPLALAGVAPRARPGPVPVLTDARRVTAGPRPGVPSPGAASGSPGLSRDCASRTSTRHNSPHHRSGGASHPSGGLARGLAADRVRPASVHEPATGLSLASS